MSDIPVFDGIGDVNSWTSKVKSQLISKGYKTQLQDVNSPAEGAAKANWDA